MPAISASSPSPLPHAPRPCRFCGHELDPLERLRGDVCGQLTCHGRAGREQALARRDAELASQRTATALRWHDDKVARAPVVWLEQHETQLVRVSTDERQAHQAHLEALARTLASESAVEPNPAPPAPDSEAGTEPLAGPLCQFCAGRCCRYGAASHGFVDAPLLRRWLARHPGASPTDAAAFYLARLPRWHVARSCLHHGRNGCTLTREMRSDICNHYACDALRQLQDLPATDSHGTVVAAMQRVSSLGDVALLQPQGPRRLTAQRRGRSR